jgi:CRP-like cAMP-binding protein
LQKVADICTRHSIKANTIIFDTSSSDENLYFVEDVHDGVQIEIPIPEISPRIVIHTLNKGEVFGWAPLGPPHIKTALARCISDCTLISLNGKAMMDILGQDSHMGFLVMKNLSEIINTRLAYTSVVFRREIHRLIKKNTVDLSI